MRLMLCECTELVQNHNILFLQCALMHMFFRNGRGVRLLEHVRLLERIQYINYDGQEYHIPSFVEIDLAVPENKIFLWFLPYMGKAAILVM